MNCQDYELALGDYVDGTLDDRARDGLAAHLAGCANCRDLVTDLQTLRQLTRNLEPVVPAPHVWTKLSKAIEEERGGGGLRSWGFTFQTLAASAVAVTLAIGLTWLGSQLAIQSAAAPVAAALDPDFDAAEAEYTTAIAGLESITTTERSALDMETADVLQANLTVIDGAISESRAALQTEPDSRAAQDSLFDALRSKVELLQDFVALINEMRQGNSEGAARIVSGLNQ